MSRSMTQIATKTSKQHHHKPLEFSFAAYADHFDEHIRRSIRGYQDLISDCVALSTYFIENETTVVDIGCSAGSFVQMLQKHNCERAPRAKYIGIEVEREFAANWDNIENVEFVLSDIRDYDVPNDSSFISSIFSLQFISEKERQAVLVDVFSSLVRGGALILAEKTLSPCAKLQDMLTSIHYDFKRSHFSDAEILEKERSLRSLMKLWTEEQITEALIRAGFSRTHIQCFWRSHNFVGFLALRM
jgi:tRNA (cmo5U34)-methyltransferase